MTFIHARFFQRQHPSNISWQIKPLRSRWSRTSSQEDDTPGRRTGQRSQLMVFSMLRVVLEINKNMGLEVQLHETRRCWAVKHENARDHQFVYPVLPQKQTSNVQMLWEQLGPSSNSFSVAYLWNYDYPYHSISITFICRARCAVSCPSPLQKSFVIFLPATDEAVSQGWYKPLYPLIIYSLVSKPRYWWWSNCRGRRSQKLPGKNFPWNQRIWKCQNVNGTVIWYITD